MNLIRSAALNPYGCFVIIDVIVSYNTTKSPHYSQTLNDFIRKTELFEMSWKQTNSCYLKKSVYATLEGH